MNRETITLMLNGLADNYISEAAVFHPVAMQESPERIVHMKKKKIIILALAAVLVFALGVTAFAAGWLAPMFNKEMQYWQNRLSEGNNTSPEFADVENQYAAYYQEQAELYEAAEQYMNEKQPQAEKVTLPEFDDSSVTLSERYYDGETLLVGVNLYEKVPDIVVGYEPDDELMKKITNVAFFSDVTGNDDLDVLLEEGMMQDIYDRYINNRTDYAKECDFRHLSAIEFDWWLENNLSPEEYETAWKTLRETGHLGVVQSIVYVGDHIKMTDGTDLGPTGQQNMDSNDSYAHSGNILIRASELPAEAQNLDRLDFLLNIRQVRVYYYMELGGPCYSFYDHVATSEVPFSVENGA